LFVLLLFALLLLCLLGGAVLALVWYVRRSKENRPNLGRAVAIPFGCAALPIVGLILLGLTGNLFQKSDEALAEELFGYSTTLTRDRMLFDDFGSGRSREIYMRAEMSDAERKKLLSIPNAVESELALEDFEARGASKGFMWWVKNDPEDRNYCASALIRDAHGFNGWQEFHWAECLDAGTNFPQSSNAGQVYVIASDRTD
jgi:hypothetical protein